MEDHWAVAGGASGLDIPALRRGRDYRRRAGIRRLGAPDRTAYSGRCDVAGLEASAVGRHPVPRRGPTARRTDAPHVFRAPIRIYL